MNQNLKVFIIFSLIILPLLGQSFMMNEASGHRSGCHRWHTCPSDSGSYTCGDTGHGCNEEEDEEDESSKSKSISKSDDDSDTNNLNPTLPAPTLSEGIEISGPITNIVDGDTLDVNDIRIRLALVNTPEAGDDGFYTAKDFVEKLCLDKNGEVNIDDGQRQGSFGRQIGVVYCDGVNLNSELMSNGYALISTEFCDVSEFSAESWAISSCQKGGGDEDNTLPYNSNQDSDTLFTKQEQQQLTPFDSESSVPTETQSYSNSKLGISLEHPTDWKVGNLKNGIQLIKEKNSVYVEIRKHNLESEDVQLIQYVSDDIKDRSSSREDFKLLNMTETTISENLPAYKALYTFLKTDNQKDFTFEGTTNQILRMWTITENSAYHVAFVADDDDYELYLPIAEQIIESLKINPDLQQSFSEDDSKDNDNNNDSKDNDNNNDSNDEDNGGDKDCSDFDKKNFKVQPGDPYDLDRDGDGIACES